MTRGLLRAENREQHCHSRHNQRENHNLRQSVRFSRFAYVVVALSLTAFANRTKSSTAVIKLFGVNRSPFHSIR